MKKKISFIQILTGFFIGIFFIVIVGIVQTYAKSNSNIRDPWDGADKSWELGTIIDGEGWLYAETMENIPFYKLEFGERVYVQYYRDGFFMIEKNYDCLSQPLLGWIQARHILLDKDVLYNK